ASRTARREITLDNTPTITCISSTHMAVPITAASRPATIAAKFTPQMIDPAISNTKVPIPVGARIQPSTTPGTNWLLAIPKVRKFLGSVNGLDDEKTMGPTTHPIKKITPAQTNGELRCVYETSAAGVAANTN